MAAREAIRAASKLSGAWARSLIDALPPYRVADGTLDGKEIGADGERLIIIDGARISVDDATFRILRPGERVKALYTTRLRRAISVTRYVERNGRGSSAG